MSEKGRGRKKREKEGEGEVIKPKRKRAKKGKKEEEEVIEPLEEQIEEKGKKWYIINLDFLRVLYSPVRTFKRIAEKPDIKGPIFILALTILVLPCYIYAYDLKFFPEPLVLELSLIPGPPSSEPPYTITEGFINYTEPRGISVFTFNWTGTVTIYGKNATGGEIFESIIISKEVLPHNTTKVFATVSKVMFDGPGNQRSQFIILGMNPREYLSLMEYALVQITQSSISMAINFIIIWALYGGILLVILQVFRQEVGSWSELFIVIGYTFVVMIFNVLATTFLTLMIQGEIKWPLELSILEVSGELRTENAKAIVEGLENRINQEAGAAYQLLTSNFLGVSSVTYATNIWMVALWVIAMRSCYGFNWKKATAISATAFISEFLLRIFIGFPWELMIIGLLVLLIKYVFK